MIDDDILAGRLPRLGSITTGFAVEATSQKGNTYGRPNRSDTLVLHTNHVEAADAALRRWGGDIREESPNWKFDVVTGVRELELRVWPAGFRQALERWRVAQINRRCDGVTMSMVEGRPDAQPCLCAAELESGATDERACSPHTVLPALLDLDVELFGVWEIRSTGWGTAANLKGTMKALAMAGVTSGAIPAVLQMQDRTTRDVSGQVREVVDLALTVASSVANLGQLATRPSPAALDTPVDPRAELLSRWSRLQTDAHSAGVLDDLRSVWADTYGDGKVEELDVSELEQWVLYAETVLGNATG